MSEEEIKAALKLNIEATKDTLYIELWWHDDLIDRDFVELKDLNPSIGE